MPVRYIPEGQVSPTFPLIESSAMGAAAAAPLAVDDPPIEPPVAPAPPAPDDPDAAPDDPDAAPDDPDAAPCCAASAALATQWSPLLSITPKCRDSPRSLPTVN